MVAVGQRLQPCSNTYFVTVMLSAQSRTVPNSISVDERARRARPTLLIRLRADARADHRRHRRPRRACDAAFRVPAPRPRAELVRDLRRTIRCAATARRRWSCLDRLGYASSKAEDGGREPRSRPGWSEAAERRARRRAAPARDEPRGLVGPRDRRHARDRAGDRAPARPRRRRARRARLHAQRQRRRGGRRRDPRAPARSRCSCAATSRRRSVVEELASHGPLPRRRPQRRDRRDPAGARDRGQALGLDDERERARAALARARDRAADAAGLVDRRDLEPRLAARARELRARRHVEGGARVGRPLPRASSSRRADPRQRRVGRRRRHRRARALPEQGGDAALGRAHAGRAARRGRRHRRRRVVSLLRRRRDGVRPDARSSTAASRFPPDGADRPQPARVRRAASRPRGSPRTGCRRS